MTGSAGGEVVIRAILTRGRASGDGGDVVAVGVKGKGVAEGCWK